MDLVGLISVLAAAYGVVLGTVALVTGWQLFRDRQSRRKRLVPPVGTPGRAERRGDEDEQNKRKGPST